MPQFAVLIDGAFATRKLGTQRNPVDAAQIDGFIKLLCSHEALAGHRLYRVYFYDAPPATDKVTIPLGGGVIDFGKTPIAKRNHALHQQLRKLDNVALRMGEVALNGWKVKDLKTTQTTIQVNHTDLVPVFQQKGVDMRIGLDIAALTLKKIAQIIVLVSGDSDFVPAMKFARREGAQLYLVPLNHGVKDSMYEHADLVLNIPLIRKNVALDPTPTPKSFSQRGPNT